MSIGQIPGQVVSTPRARTRMKYALLAIEAVPDPKEQRRLALGLLGDIADAAMNNVHITRNGRSSYPAPNHSGAAKAVGVAMRILGLDLGDPKVMAALDMEVRELKAKTARMMANSPSFSDKLRKVG